MSGSDEQKQEVEDLGDGYYRLDINKGDLVAAYESANAPRSADSE